MKCLPVLSLTILAACQQNLAHVNLTVYPDKQGEVLYHAWTPGDASKGDQANRGDIFQNVKDLRSIDVAVRVIGGKFQDLDQVKIGDVTFEYLSGERQSVLKVTIPTTAEAKWYKTLGLTEAQIWKMHEVGRMAGLKDEPPAVVFSMSMPGEIERQRFVEPAEAPAWKMGTGRRDGFGGEGKNTACLVIPMSDIRTGKCARIVWEITCGPLLESVKTQWMKYKEATREPDRVKVQHILVSWSGASRSKSKLTFAQAEKKAIDLYELLQAGADFEEMMKKESEDPGVGTYTMVDKDRTPAKGESPRASMVKGFGDAAFRLKVGEMVLLRYDEKTSPFGWHILRRIE